MKRTLFFSLGVIFSFGYYSCKKNVAKDSSQVAFDQASTSRISNSTGVSSFFDPSGLVSSSQHGVLDTIQKGFGFTEGPAVDKHGNVFFTDQPNDKIYRGNAAT